MKKNIHIFLSIFLAGVILTSSSGLFLNKMVCLISGKSVVSLTIIDQCQGEQKAELASKCCDISHVLLKMKIDANKEPFSFNQLSFVAPVIYFFAEQHLTIDHNRAILQFADLPPPKTQSAHLSLLQSYLI